MAASTGADCWMLEPDTDITDVVSAGIPQRGVNLPQNLGKPLKFYDSFR
jgi:hypothetical protein